MSDYATVSDIIELKRPLTNEEQVRATMLIPIICSLIRYEAKKTGRDYDQMIYESELVTVVDTFSGDGAKTIFTLSAIPQGTIFVTVNGTPVSEYTVENKSLMFTIAPTGEILVMYEYRALADIAKGVVCDIVMRELNTPGTQLPATSYSEGAGSVSQSFSLPNASGSIKLWPSDMKALGLKRQKLDSLSLMDPARCPSYLPPKPRRI